MKILILACLIIFVKCQKLQTVYEWKYVDYLWESDLQKQQFIQSGNYNYTHINLLDVDVAMGKKTIVRF